jgi:8-oxo-dGTP pyrophosphatase MutT (NUDIX family)
VNFTEFENSIPKLTNITPGGIDAQYKLAPEMRLPISELFLKSKRPKKAAVLSLFFPNSNNETCFLLTLRANYKGTHAAQISFPGGKLDEFDKDLKYTALRETFEEIGIEKNSVTVFKQMTNVYIPPSNFLVTPFLGYINYTPIFKTNFEVEKVITITLKDFLNDSCISRQNITTSNLKNVEVPCFVFNNFIVWGATAMMLSEIREVFKNY